MNSLQKRPLTGSGHCFACGPENVYGLRMKVRFQDGQALCNLTLDPQYQGWENIAHGGIVSTVLDEITAYAVIGMVGQGVTVRMETAYRQPVPLGQPIVASARVVEHKKRMAVAQGRIALAEDNSLLAEATSRWLLKLGPDGQPLDGSGWLPGAM
ncbi:MAG: PaaI family thioesterase [Desulfarculaceae bacterium]|nr:PaaI family thioesterase [Desulfarculaceae bacterium]MCF8072060.1 PaaI family thioesterase [Desulfarculaceae bacterium]MCF8101577.1 PaaI family thioesterase [Desulfarculaceae bacterium]MCF8115127.1 PaaI family thioesterase [Desulfarculaceae bacterium]